MNLADEYIYISHGNKEFRWEGMQMSAEYGRLEEADYIPTAPFELFRDMKEGDRFDLGGVTIGIYDLPGHTKGSVVMLIKEERMLLLGDGCNESVFMFEDYSLSLEVYEENLKVLQKKLSGTYDVILSSHGSGVSPRDIMAKIIAVCEEIKAGTDDAVPFVFRGNRGVSAKKIIDGGITREDGGSGNIIYNKNKIYK